MATSSNPMSSDYHNVDSDVEIEIDHTIKVEYQNEDNVLTTNCKFPSWEGEPEEGEVFLDDPLGDIPDPGYSSTQPQVFIGGPTKKRRTSKSSCQVGAINSETSLNMNNIGPKTRYPCPTCGKTFIYKHLVFRHVLSAHNGTIFLCRLCEKKFLKKEELDKHLGCHTHNMTELHDFRCVQCAINFDTHDDLDSHIRSSHPAVSAFQITYKCSLCGREFKQKSLLTRHEKRHRNASERSRLKYLPP
ncbi:zinc finger and SCAN domain-containing protein 10 isoform X2 [Folsomia candida]|nr:zinc finger and SCAN domain-containing protein 10 isoform X2 [Folsomia candida]